VKLDEADVSCEASRHSQDDCVAAMVTMVTAMPDPRRCGKCAEVKLA